MIRDFCKNKKSKKNEGTGIKETSFPIGRLVFLFSSLSTALIFFLDFFFTKTPYQNLETEKMTIFIAPLPQKLKKILRLLERYWLREDARSDVSEKHYVINPKTIFSKFCRMIMLWEGPLSIREFIVNSRRIAGDIGRE